MDLLLGGNYEHQPGYYPGGGYGGGYYPGQQGPAGPPGAHAGCPLCDSSVYSYCSYKQAHDSCCCGNGCKYISFLITLHSILWNIIILPTLYIDWIVIV